MASSVCVCDEYFTVNDTGELCLIPGRQGLRQINRYGSPGTYQFRKADYPWLARVRVRVQAAGGGSAGARASTGEASVSQGAAGGGYSEALIDVSALGPVETIVVGRQGAAGGPTTDGGDGEGSSFGGLVTANGGAGSNQIMSSGTSPSANSGTQAPSAGSGSLLALGGGAGGGSVRLSGTVGLSGAGGDSHLGHGGIGRASNGANSGRGFGGGAGGAFARNGASENGAPGQNGIVLVELYG
ncbi:hypothetical protein ACWEQC_22245 [Streptomyces shenzhenensis]